MGKVYRIGWLGPTPGQVQNPFLEELRRLRWIEGQNFVMDYRLPKGKYERLPALAAELLRLEVDVIVTFLTVATRAAKEATTTIPIAFSPISDPVGEGFLENLARPGGNLTGMTNQLPEMGGKGLELLKEALPGISRVGVLWQPGRTMPANFSSVKEFAHAEGRQKRR